MDNTAIEWCDATWNPLVGCSRVSEGCVNCYAERHAYRFARQAGTVYEGVAKLVNGRPTFTGVVNLSRRALEAPLSWKRPRRIFVNSMSDLFHPNVSPGTIAAIFGIMAACPQHTFQVLTKRPQRMLRWFGLLSNDGRQDLLHEAVKNVMGYDHPKRPAVNLTQWPLPNVWLGVSAENQETADERIPTLLQTPAAKRFVSFEPLLGGIIDAIAGIDWAIVGGESGPGARPMDLDWARSLRDECAVASVPFFFKQVGTRRYEATRRRLMAAQAHDGEFAAPKKGGCLLDGREHKEWPA